MSTATTNGATATEDWPAAVPRFPITLRIQAYEMALARGLHLVRDNYHLWGIRKGDKAHVWLCSSNSYDGLWRAACNTFRDPEFDVKLLPYSVGETATYVKLYDPRTGEHRQIPKKDLRSRRGQD